MFRVNSQRVVYISSLHWVVIDWPDLLAPLSPLSGLVHPQPGSTGVNLAEEMSSWVNKPFSPPTTLHTAHCAIKLLFLHCILCTLSLARRKPYAELNKDTFAPPFEGFYSRGIRNVAKVRGTTVLPLELLLVSWWQWYENMELGAHSSLISKPFLGEGYIEGRGECGIEAALGRCVSSVDGPTAAPREGLHL